MKTRNSYARILVLIAFVVGCSTVFAAYFARSVAGQEQGWQMVRADYGYKSQRRDVTGLVGDLIARGGVNGRVAVNNQTMGGDPAVGKDKNLRIFARNRRREEREFDYPEGGSIDVSLFVIRNDDWDDDRGRGGNFGGRDRDDWNGLRIIRAYYGMQRNTTNVTELLQRMVHDRMLSVRVDNNNLGGDPAVGADKVLIVIYRYQGREQAVVLGEGNTLTIP